VDATERLLEEAMSTMSNRSWRMAGILATAYVVLAFVGAALEGVTGLLGTGPDEVRSQYVQAPITRAMTGGYLEALGALAFLAVAAFLHRATLRDREPAGWLSLTGFAAAVAYSGTTALAAGAAALYGAQHGADTSSVAALNNLRNFGFFLGFLPLGLFTCAIAGLAISRAIALPRWIGWIGLPVGIAQFVGAAGAGAELQNFAMLLWFAWFVVFAGTMVVRRRVAVVPESALHPVVA
jgi:hypothetical protein